VKTRAALSVSFGVVVLATIGWQIHEIGAGNSARTASGSTVTPSIALRDGTFTGRSETTRYGDVQVAIVVTGGRITDATTPTLSGNEGRSNQINNQAAPILRAELLQSQSATIQSVSGATYTSGAYITSLQSAFDQAKS